MAWWEIDTIIQDRKKRKIRVAQQKGSMVNLSPSITVDSGNSELGFVTNFVY